jgi:hypothetical protein
VSASVAGVLTVPLALVPELVSADGNGNLIVQLK